MKIVQDYWNIGWTGPAFEFPDDYKGNSMEQYRYYQHEVHNKRSLCTTCGTAFFRNDDRTFFHITSVPFLGIVGNTANFSVNTDDKRTLFEIDEISLKEFSKAFTKDIKSYFTSGETRKVIELCAPCYTHPEWWGDLMPHKLKLDSNYRSFIFGDSEDIEKQIVEYHKNSFGSASLTIINEQGKELKYEATDEFGIIRHLVLDIIGKGRKMYNDYSHDSLPFINEQAIIPNSLHHILGINGTFKYGIRGKEFMNKLVESESLKLGSINLDLFKDKKDVEQKSNSLLKNIEELSMFYNLFKAYNSVSNKKDPFNPFFLYLLFNAPKKELIGGYSSVDIIRELVSFLNAKIKLFTYVEHPTNSNFPESMYMKTRLGENTIVIKRPKQKQA